MNSNWPTEVLIQEMLDTRKSIRMRVICQLYNPAEKSGKAYHNIPSGTLYLEVGSPGMVWRIVASVVQALKRLEVELEHEEESNEGFKRSEYKRGLNAQPHPGDERYSHGGRPRKDGSRSISGSQTDSERRNPDASDNGTSEGDV